MVDLEQEAEKVEHKVRAWPAHQLPSLLSSRPCELTAWKSQRCHRMGFRELMLLLWNC